MALILSMSMKVVHITGALARLSQNQPLCDGSHLTTDFQPVAFTAEKSGTVYLCGCKKTGRKPYCDGSHSK